MGAASAWSLWAFALAALVAIVQWQRWKRRARKHKQEVAVWKEALGAVAFETTNAVNAMRANLVGFRQVNPSVALPDHLDEVETGTQRIAAILKIAADPVAWHRQKNARAGGA